jgi:16S rRNA (cytidine1402-2'-O)-methyltransferase
VTTSAGTSGRLLVIALPLGNPEDLSPRAGRALAQAEVVLAEDTRSARRVLREAGVARPEQQVLSCFDANEADRAAQAVDWIANGRTVALISEAGTPLLSDPGYRVVAAVAAAGFRVEPIPGPSALLAALVASGLPCDRFLFLGFPPRKEGARRRLLETLRGAPYTLVFYESPVRVGATLADVVHVLGGSRRACVARELTKTHEELVRGTVAELATRYAEERPLGEVTLVVAGTPDTPAEPGAGEPSARSTEEWMALARDLLATGKSARDVADELAARSGRPRREMYALVLAAR